MNKIKKKLFICYSLIFISLLLSSTIFNYLFIKITFAVENRTNIKNYESSEKYILIIQNIRNLLEQLSLMHINWELSKSKSIGCNCLY